jgi:hypothetical protein
LPDREHGAQQICGKVIRVHEIKIKKRPEEIAFGFHRTGA